MALVRPVFFCCANEDIYAISGNAACSIYCRALEPLIAIGFTESKLLVCNSAASLSWFLLPNSKSATSGRVEYVNGSISVVDTDSNRQCMLQCSQDMFSSDQIHRILLSVCEYLEAANFESCSPDVANNDTNSATMRCVTLSKEEYLFFAPIARQWILENLVNFASFFKEQKDICRLPFFRKKRENLDSLCKWLADNVRDTTGVRYVDALASVKCILLALQRPVRNGGVLAEANLNALLPILIDAENESQKIRSASSSGSQDRNLLMTLVSGLTAWVEDAQRSASWRSSAEDSELVDALGQINQLLVDADPELCISALQEMCPLALESLTTLYRLEKSQDVRYLVRDFASLWLQLLVSCDTDGSSAILRLFAQEAGGGPLLTELFRELISNEALQEKAVNSILNLCDILLQNKIHFGINVNELPCDISALFEALLRIAGQHEVLISSVLNIIERVVVTMPLRSSLEHGQNLGSVMLGCLVSSSRSDVVETVIDTVNKRYISLTLEKFPIVKGVFDDLIAILTFWTRVIADPQLLEHGLVHTSDLNVLNDFCSRQLEALEGDSSAHDLQNAYLHAQKLFTAAISVDFF